jgi:hypothetical protein
LICFLQTFLLLRHSLTCRVLFVNLSAKVIGLSAAPHVVKLSPVVFDVKYGDVVDPATIIRVDAGVGVTLSFAPLADAPRKKDAETLNALCSWGTTAFCHISRLSDSRVEHVERSYTVGSVVNCRVVGESRCCCCRLCWLTVETPTNRWLRSVAHGSSRKCVHAAINTESCRAVVR